MKRLGSRVNLIPVIAKADTMTQEDLANYKVKVREVISAQGIKVYCPPIDEEEGSRVSVGYRGGQVAFFVPAQAAT